MQRRTNGKVKISLTLTLMQDKYLDTEVKSGNALTKQDVVRRLIDERLEVAA